MTTWPTRTSREVLDYAYDWTPCLADDTIARVEASATGGLIVDRVGFVGNVQVVWLSGGTSGAVARVSLVLHTAGSRTFDQDVQITIR